MGVDIRGGGHALSDEELEAVALVVTVVVLNTMSGRSSTQRQMRLQLRKRRALLQRVVEASDCMATSEAAVQLCSAFSGMPSHDYYGHKQAFAVQAQMVMDLDLRILDVHAGYHESGELFDALPENLPHGVVMRGYLLGDNGYPVACPWIVQPYGGIDQPPDEERFDTKQKVARGCVERAFGRLNCMWCLFLRTHKMNLETLPQQFIVVCTLHNILLDAGIEFDENLLWEVESNDVEWTWVLWGRHARSTTMRKRRRGPVVGCTPRSVDIDESKKEQGEHNARIEAMMRNMRPTAVRAPLVQQGLAPAPVLGGAANNLNVCYACHQLEHLARDCPHRPPQQRVEVAPMAAAPIANGPGGVGALMEETEGREEAAELIPLDQYVSLGYPGLGMIGTIRPAPEQKEVAEWRPSPAMNMTFQNFVNKTRLTQGMINFCVIVYMDDILVYSEAYHGHAQHIEWTLGALRDAGFKILLEKSEFFLLEISFLGYVVTRGGLRPDSRKVAAVREAPVPTSLTQVRAFLGLASNYRHFIKGFAAIARPLTNLLRKDQPLNWDTECQQASATLKDALATAPILIRSDPSKKFILITDWQPEAISAILAQKGNDGREHVIEYASRTVPDERRNDSAPQGECYAVVWGIQHFHPYL
ncbi:hypothetical protein CBR_g19137 [Chara braunii]|uniref:CCHC-type domain-containing protein n=1 Tax=Chara braunii TaxID=69332 RepID=A0A388KXG5_CHABU|nr:hypothetical protein CBR_g19137 [Chara braunii]|eukprot:GBG74731.1 hypothetical protein CBR_g19137 [Chara braunii]